MPINDALLWAPLAHSIKRVDAATDELVARVNWWHIAVGTLTQKIMRADVAAEWLDVSTTIDGVLHRATPAQSVVSADGAAEMARCLYTSGCCVAVGNAWDDGIPAATQGRYLYNR